ncbi:MAG: DUF6785 family protein [Armatimonadota bacterium]
MVAANGPQPSRPERDESAFTFRSVALSVVAIVAVVFFIHWAELVLGSRRGHTAMANTSIPVGPFFALFIITLVNLLIARLRPRWALRQKELVLIYILMATSCVVASSGGIHFLVPTLTAAFYYASPENNWEQFHGYIPGWFAPRDEGVLKPFYMGEAAVPWTEWLVPMLVWCGFLFVFYFGTLCICAMLRRQWIERERLTFPTVYVPLHMTDRRSGFWKDRAMWIGFALPFLIGTVNTLHLNYPQIPQIQVRPYNIAQNVREAPWSAVGSVAISFYPFIIGIAYLLSLEMTFSCWFFYIFTLAERVFGAATGLNEWGRGVSVSRFPFEANQGAGAFLALTLIALFVGRAELGSLVGAPFKATGARADRWPMIGLLTCFVALVLFCRAAGATYHIPAILLLLAWTYMTAATRIRAETGNAWLFGPRVDPHLLMVQTFGSARFPVRDLTVMAYLSNISSWDLRCIPMPHQLDGFKMSGESRIRLRPLVPTMSASLFFGLVVAFAAGLWVWYRFGALAHLDPWRTNMGKQPFNRLVSYLTLPLKPDGFGTGAAVAGMAFTIFLAVMRTRFLWWPFHPVGYAMANTPTMRNTWLPFMIAWAAKAAILRYGGPKTYRRLLPFFLGLIIGDFANGGFWTLMGCFFDINVYPVNW